MIVSIRVIEIVNVAYRNYFDDDDADEAAFSNDDDDVRSFSNVDDYHHNSMDSLNAMNADVCAMMSIRL